MISAWKRRMKRAAVQWLTLPPDALLNVSRLTCTGGQDVVIENIRELRHVSSNVVEVALESETLVLRGADFTVTLVSDREVHVTGQVDAVVYQRKEGKAR